MINTISHAVLFVKDQDEALSFYRDKVGFKLHTDMPFDSMRWLTVQPATQANFELVLMKAVNSDAQALVGKQGAGAPFLCMSSSDCKADFERLRKNGVDFIQEPTVKPWGIEALFLDLYGNLICLVQSMQP
jgi:predicted enzyme related to lactoylglutathione lyase